MFLLTCSCNKKDSNDVIGVLFPMTGDAASYGEKGKKAIDLAVEMANKRGGNFKIIIEDSKANPKTGVSAANKLVKIDKVQAIVGDIVSSVTIPVANICETNKVVLIAPTSSAPAITEAGEYIFRVWPSDLAEGKAAGKYAKENNYNSVAILHLNNDYGISIAKIFSKSYLSGNNSVVIEKSYDKDQNDFKTVLSAIKKSKPDLIYIAGYYTDVAKIILQAKQMGIKSQFMGVTAIEDNEFLKIAKTSAEGIIYPLASGYDPNSKNKKSKQFTKEFISKYGYTPGWVEAHCFDAINIIFQAYENCNNCTGEDIKTFIENNTSFEGVTGKIVFDKNGDVIRKVIYKTVKDGKFEELK